MITRGSDAAPFNTKYKDSEIGDYIFMVYRRYAILTISKLSNRCTLMLFGSFPQGSLLPLWGPIQGLY